MSPARWYWFTKYIAAVAIYHRTIRAFILAWGTPHTWTASRFAGREGRRKLCRTLPPTGFTWFGKVPGLYLRPLLVPLRRTPQMGKDLSLDGPVLSVLGQFNDATHKPEPLRSITKVFSLRCFLRVPSWLLWLTVW